MTTRPSRSPRWPGLLLGMLLCSPRCEAQATNVAPPSDQEQAAVALQQAGDWPKALTAFAALAGAEPQNPRAAFGHGAALHETGDPKGAISEYLRARALGYQPANQIRVRLARVYALTGEKEQALSELEALAAAGFTQEPVLQHKDLTALSGEPRFQAVILAVRHNAHPCAADPNFRKFDFWVGDWDVQQTGVPRAPVGASSHVERILDGCVVFENWSPGPNGPAGKSFNIFNRVTGKWEQYWVDATGRITHYFGEFREDGNLYYEADQFGTANKVRMTFFNQGPDEVRQLGHLSTDGGKTWTVSFDLTYLRKK